MYKVRFVGTAGDSGPFRDEKTATWWAAHERDGKTAIVVPVTPA